MSDLLRDFSRQRDELFGLSLRQLILFIAIVFALGIYVGELLFGTNSLEVYMRLEEKTENLKREVSALQRENARLQKDYFELKTLEPK